MGKYVLLHFDYEGKKYPIEDVEFDTIENIEGFKKIFKYGNSLNGHPIYATYKSLTKEDSYEKKA
jgi:hypothetical protein